ncbi:DUF3263 domain-containing protein [Galactobacter caseinivorans]|uniref:DUF3263 domain-containing protein n=1 Tax=Galactobacter caseinivorans TaxID=2676123 RepID=A0A496PG42_9MICC|nr:DUF3263 domain-containing protein [Galactobacter caseinivorans]
MGGGADVDEPVESEAKGPLKAGLSALDQAMLDLEARSSQRPGAKQETIRSTLHMTSAQFYQRLNALIDTEAALAYAPMLVRRLRASREGRLRVPGRPTSG